MKNEVSEGIVLYVESGDIKPNLKFLNRKIYPSLELLHINREKSHHENENLKVFQTRRNDQKQSFLIKDVSLALTNNTEVLLVEPIIADDNHCLFYLVINDQDKHEIKPEKPPKGIRLIAQSVEKDVNNTVVRKFLYKITVEEIIEIATGVKKNHVGYLWLNRKMFYGPTFDLQKIIDEQEQVSSYI